LEDILAVRHHDWIAHFGRRTPDKPAAIDLASGRQFTYAQFDTRISRLASHLRDRIGIKRGERIAVLAMNTTDTLEVQFACGRIGAVFLPLNTRLTVPELQYIVGDAAPALMIHDAELAEAALTVAKLCGVGSILSLGADQKHSTERSWSRWMTSPPSCTPPVRPASPRAPSSPMA
jgi:fatty-acyl-CoA synthase